MEAENNMARITISHKLLQYLSPDPADLRDIAEYLYGEDTLRRRTNTMNAINYLQKQGWGISCVDYSLDEKQYAAVQNMKWIGTLKQMAERANDE